MAFENLLTLPLTADGSGAINTTLGALVASITPIGVLRKLRYVHNGTNTFSNGATITLTGANSGAVLLAATVTTGNTDQEWSPQNPAVLSTTGVAPSSVTIPYADVPLGNEDVAVVVAGAGAGNKATLYLWIGD